MFWIKIFIVITITGMKPVELTASAPGRLIDSAHATIPYEECYKLALPIITQFGHTVVDGRGAEYEFTCTQEVSE